MKRTMMIGAGVLALMAGSAHAGGCSYSKQVTMAAAEPAAEPVVIDEARDTSLLAMLKERDLALEKELPAVHN